ncbi:MAG: NTP transferase domain-containing protein, partial [Burkholderiaceae bacterium]
MLSVVVPMAGRGSRFAAAGRTPKPFIEVEAGRPMLSYVVEHLRFAEPHRFVFVALADDARAQGLAGLLARIAPHHALVLVDAVTGGPTASVLRAVPKI